MEKKYQVLNPYPKREKVEFHFSFSTLAMWHNFTFLILFIDIFNTITFKKDMKKQLRRKNKLQHKNLHICFNWASDLVQLS